MVEAADGQLLSRNNQQPAFIAGLDDMILKNTIEAEMRGIELFLKLPELALEDFKDQLNELKEVIDNAENN